MENKNLVFIDALYDAMEKSDNEEFEFTCPLCKLKAQGKYKINDSGRKIITKGICKTCKIEVIV